MTSIVVFLNSDVVTGKKISEVENLTIWASTTHAFFAAMDIYFYSECYMPPSRPTALIEKIFPFSNPVQNVIPLTNGT